MNEQVKQRFAGIERLYGVGALERLQGSRVAVVGMGGVGSWVVEALARSAVSGGWRESRGLAARVAGSTDANPWYQSLTLPAFQPPPALFSKKGAYARLMDWSMKDPVFKTQLFRFVDVLPSLNSSAEIVRHLLEAPAALNAALAHDDDIASMAHLIAPARDVLYLGRGTDYPIALEGALKLKEISYIHAEGYAAGEMKHGPIALIDELVPVICIAPSGPLFEKTVSNMQEVQARGGKVVLISDYDGVQAAGEGCLATITMPKVHPLIAPMVYAVPVQLLAYHVAVLKGTDVDQPRNLAKSVTVE